MKIFLVGGKDKAYRTAFDFAKTKYILISFLELKKDLSFLSGRDVENILLDSGAFTFMNSQKNAKIDWDKYIEEYAELINRANIKYFFELDIDVIVGIQEVERLRAKLEALTGKQAIPVWHKARGVDYWRKMCENYKYIAIGGLVTKEIVEKEYPVIKNMVNYANKNGVKVHGLGFTRMKWLPIIKWHSVDSTSWLGSIVSYRHYRFNGKEIKADAIVGFDSKKRQQLWNSNANEWTKYQGYADKYL